MASITFITHNNERITVEGSSGSIMELAVQHNISGIDGDCGGVCSCATCHVHIDPKDIDIVGEASELEKDLLEFDEKVCEHSRLSCQLPITEKLDGLILRVAN